MRIGFAEGRIYLQQAPGAEPVEITPQQLAQITGQRDYTQSVAEEVGPADAAMIAAGRTARGMGAGIQRLLGMENTGLQQELAATRGGYEALQEASPVSTAVGSALPYLAMPAAPAAWGALRGVPLMAGASGALSALDTEAGGTAAERAAWGTVGGAAGETVGRVLARAGTVLGLRGGGAPLRVQDDIQRAARELADTGGEVTPGLERGSQRLMVTEDRYAHTPAGREFFGEMFRRNQKNTNRLFIRALGLPDSFLSAGGDITMETLDMAEQALSRRAAQVGRAIGDDIQLPKQLAQDMNELLSRPNVSYWLQRNYGASVGEDFIDAKLTGQSIVGGLRSALTELAGEGDQQARGIIFGTPDKPGALDLLDNVIRQRAGPEVFQQYMENNARFGLLRTLQRKVNSEETFTPTATYNAARDAVRGTSAGRESADPAIRELIKNLRARSVIEKKTDGLNLGNSRTALREGDLARDIWRSPGMRDYLETGRQNVPVWARATYNDSGRIFERAPGEAAWGLLPRNLLAPAAVGVGTPAEEP